MGKASKHALVIDGECLEDVMRTSAQGELVGSQAHFLRFTQHCSAVEGPALAAPQLSLLFAPCASSGRACGGPVQRGTPGAEAPAPGIPATAPAARASPPPQS